jgi:hypothetical protein
MPLSSPSRRGLRTAQSGGERSLAEPLVNGKVGRFRTFPELRGSTRILNSLATNAQQGRLGKNKTLAAAFIGSPRLPRNCEPLVI